jgi:hypothetical protein
MAENKRPNEGSPESDAGNQLVAAKKQKTDGQLGLVTKDGIKRTSSLLAPTMQLKGQVRVSRKASLCWRAHARV